uniref:tRNA(Ile)-lysidine synthetase n=1 Tax=Mycena chlorophos TaxID=658473 RepID=A0ABQ0KYL7_MYCCL|nr:predicted protein [Mycena chlorophos]
MLRRCQPPNGWTSNISVANSGGPDSTCLLFLLNRHVQTVRAKHPDGVPSQVQSITVDHNLQPNSAKMAQATTDFATKLGIPHTTIRVPWGQHPVPKRPETGEAFEGIGRGVRYRLLLDQMVKMDSFVLALGHHGDDQVETSLMRLAKGTSEMGAGGMRKIRRWGMGMHNDDLLFAGMAGMQRWMIRPFLDVGKDRLLATCDANNLEFVTDETNFQPELTLRNAIRKLVSQNSFDPESLGPDIPFHITEGLQQIQANIASLESVEMDPSGGLDHLRDAVTVLSDQAIDVDGLVDSALNRCHLPSPAGTYLVSSRGLATIKDPLVRQAFVLRIMRYVSFFAWGTVRADANRRRSSLQRIISALFTDDPFQSGAFVAGGGVVWTPVVVTNNRIRFGIRNHAPPPRDGDIYGWLASRQVPFMEARLRQLNMPNVLKIDITERMRQRLVVRDTVPKQTLEVLWDCRFLLKIDIDRVPDDLARKVLMHGAQLWIYPHSRWFWPKVVHLNARGDYASGVTLHSTLSVPENGLVRLDRDVMEKWPQAYNRDVEEVTTDWVQTEWIRSLSAF